MTNETLACVPPFAEAPLWGSASGWGDAFQADVVAHQKRVDSLRQLKAPIEHRSDLYASLVELLGLDIHDRFVLYCPSYLIPNARDYKNYGSECEEFCYHFMAAWYHLLEEDDYRHTFIDGDVPDDQIELIERTGIVRQAAFLAPMLESKGWVTKNRLGSDPILRKSLKLAYSDDYGLLDYHNNRRSLNDTSNNPARIKWLAWEKKRFQNNIIGGIISQDLEKPEDFAVINYDQDIKNNAIRCLIERQTTASIHQAQSTYFKFRDYLLQQDMSDSLMHLLLRLRSANVISDFELSLFQLKYPNLTKNLHENLLPWCDKINHLLEEARILNDLVYPVIAVYGSQLKGYGRIDGDLDFAVFVKPGAAFVESREVIDKVFSETPTKFYLSEEKGDLRIQPTWSNGPYGAPSDAHVLFNSCWYGDDGDVSQMRERLLRPFIAEPNFALRRLWLSEIERDLLCYRLLHRGFSFVHKPNSWVFLDDNYRTIACELYVRYVHLFSDSRELTTF